MERKAVEHKQEEKEYSISVKEDDEILKKKISCHSLYGLLLDSHLDCLKVSFSFSRFHSLNDEIIGHVS